MNEIREIPCPTCGHLFSLDASDVRPGMIVPCNTCRLHLVVTMELTLTHATNDAMGKRPIREQEVGRMMQRMWSGMPKDVYC